MEKEQYVSAAVVAEQFSVKAEYIQQLARAGVIPAVRFTPKGHFRFLLSEVEKSMISQQTAEDGGEVK